MKKSRDLVFNFPFSFHRSFASFVVEQFGIWRWKANGKINLMISKHLKIGRLQPQKWQNMFERIQKMKKSCICTVHVQYILSNPNILLLTSRILARKVQELVLTLNLAQEPKNAMRPREVRLQKGPRG